MMSTGQSCCDTNPGGQSGTNRRTLPGWNDGPKILKTQANFWHRVWMEAGCPSSGVLSNIRKARYKFAVHRIKRRKYFIIREKLAYSREHKNAREFWDVVNRNIKSKHSSPAPIVDGISEDKEIADLLALNLKNLLNNIPEDECGYLYTKTYSDTDIYFSDA